MAIKVARGQVTIIDQNDAVSLQAFIGSSQPLTQVFNKDTGAYAPSWAASPYLILTPSLFVSGKAAVDQISSVGNAATLTAGVKSGSAKWYKDGTVITSGQDSCTIGAASAKYALTVKANHMTVSAPQVRYTFEAIYIDANGLLILLLKVSAMWTYLSVVLMLLCPISSFTILMSVPCSSKWVANEWRSRCG